MVCSKPYDTESDLSKVPTEPCVMGIDEAGRGPVLGPMVYGAAFAPGLGEKQKAVKELGVMDSKMLNEANRDRLFDVIKASQSTIGLGWMVTVLSAAEISEAMLRRSKYNLNALSHNTARDLVQKALDNGVNVKEVYVDTVGDPDIYKNWLSSHFRGSGIEFTVTKKADSKFPIVSAASICAKVTRDFVLKHWEFEEKSINREMELGCGYPGDSKTKRWLEKHVDPVFGFPSVVRFSWSTADEMLKKRARPVHWGDEDDEVSAIPPPRNRYFTERDLRRSKEL